jgi:hypothetical protein
MSERRGSRGRRKARPKATPCQVNNEAITQMDSLCLIRGDIQSVIMYVSWEYGKAVR